MSRLVKTRRKELEKLKSLFSRNLEWVMDERVEHRRLPDVVLDFFERDWKDAIRLLDEVATAEAECDALSQQVERLREALLLVNRVASPDAFRTFDQALNALRHIADEVQFALDVAEAKE